MVVSHVGDDASIRCLDQLCFIHAVKVALAHIEGGAAVVAVPDGVEVVGTVMPDEEKTSLVRSMCKRETNSRTDLAHNSLAQYSMERHGFAPGRSEIVRDDLQVVARRKLHVLQNDGVVHTVPNRCRLSGVPEDNPESRPSSSVVRAGFHADVLVGVVLCLKSLRQTAVARPVAALCKGHQRAISSQNDGRNPDARVSELAGSKHVHEGCIGL
mmetsp:Transcript_36997/g.86014  ORF Transcript_36997/g.86014 Transcript_36997/m.86014 type:complete len:213 (+) Transcript_36997:406-1044(+)